MRFPNAYGGVKKIFIAEILLIIVALLGGVAVVSGIAGLGAAGAGSAEGAMVGLGGTILSGIGVLVLSLIALILNLVGLHQAGKDEATYLKPAFYLTIVQIVASIIGSFFQAGVMGGVMGLINRLLSIAICFLVIYGIMKLAAELNREDMVSFGNKIVWIIVITYMLSWVADIIPAATAKTVLGVIGAILMIVGGIAYLVFLSKATKMLQAK